MDINTLRRFRFLRLLDDEALRELAGQARERQYRPGELIFEEGGRGENFYLVHTGRVLIFRTGPEGETAMNEMQAGDSFGEMSLLDNEPRSAAARAMTDTWLIEIAREPFLLLVQRYPVVLAQAERNSSDRLRRRDQEWIRELETRNAQLQKLYDTSLSISRHLELGNVLRAIASSAAALLDCSEGQLYLYDRETGRLVTTDGQVVRSTGKGAWRALKGGEPVIEKRGGEYVLCAPICLESERSGVLAVSRPAAAPAFSPQDARLLQLFANQAAIAIDNARLHRTAVDKARLDGELQAAYKVQQSLLPRTIPRIPGFQAAALWKPARQVAGDFYDLFPLPDHRWAIVIADVTDKGMSAALFMASSRSIIRASAAAGTNAADIIARANRALADDAQNGMFVTLFFARLDPRSRTLDYVNAGHNPPLLLRARSGSLEALKRTTLPLGLDAASRVASGQVVLEKGDSLVLYTDGVTEAANAGAELYGEERLLELLKDFGPSGARALARAVDKSIVEFTGEAPLADDVTLVVLHAKE